jgi:mono/diheme cytochrome c family protein
MRARISAVLFVSLLFGAGCASGRQSEPLKGAEKALTAEEIAGQRVFMRECNGCHPQGHGGLGPALNNKPVPGVAIKLQVRQGLGAMPAFSEKEISSQELDALVAFITAKGAPW